MNRDARRLIAQQIIAVGLLLTLTACGGSSPNSPSPTPTPSVPTRIIALTGNLGFGGIPINTTSTRTFNILNQGNAPLTVTGITATGGLTTVAVASWTSGTVPAGGSQPVTITFSPKTATIYSGTLTINGDQTSGANTILMTGAGTLDNVPVFTRAGTGDTVFDIPSHVTRIQITGAYNANSSNFIVRIAGSTVVNELLGTGWNQTFFQGTYLIAGGGTVQIVSSSGVAWTFTEVRQ
jgi:hypothetical protein